MRKRRFPRDVLGEMIGVAVAILVITVVPGGIGVVPRVALGLAAAAVMLLRTLPWD
ncbi:MAG: hypothetical protein HY826_00345 [Actinobacteria bacterium]|nr:hypothetical protein [Actinomycetota bacterium]